MKKFLLISIMLFLFSCKTDDSEEIYAESATHLDVSYGSHALQNMDIYLPENRSKSKTKVMVLVHGGGWANGDKSDFNPEITTLKQEFPDFAIANINYRLVGNGTNYMLPAQTDDIQSALDYLDNKSSQYGIKSEYVLVGTSAGGHLSMLYSYKFDTKKRVKAVVSTVGSTNLSDPYYVSYPQYSILIQYIMNASEIPSGYTAPQYASPITWISNSSVPTISFFGNTDEMVPPSQKTFLDQKLNQHNVPNESYIYNGGHGIGGEYKADVIQKAKIFIKNNVN